MQREKNSHSLSREDAYRVELLLPPVAEQRRIAAILDQAEALRAQRRNALQLIHALRESLFLDQFGNPFTNPLKWPMATVGEIADVQGGLQVTSTRKALPVEVPYLRVANVYRGRLALLEIKTIRATAAEVARTQLLQDDLLVVEGHGNPEEIGRTAVWTGEIESCVHQNHLIRVRVDQERALAMYCAEYLNSRGGRQYLLRSGKSTSGLNTINVSNVRATPIALPPLERQKVFADSLRSVKAIELSHASALVELDVLVTSLQHRVFSGQL